MILVVIVILILYWFYWVMRLRNPYKFSLYVGKRGSGKSTQLTKLALKYKKKPYIIIYDKDRPRFKRWYKQPLKIYSNSDIVGVETISFNPLDLGISFFPEPYSILFCDEISLYWWNRNFKSMNEKTVEWFRNMRKYKCKVFGFTQSFDIDKVLRKSLCDKMYLVKSFFITWTLIREIDKQQDIKESALDCDSQFAETLRYKSILIPGAIQFNWIPKYIKYFDTNLIFSKEKS